MATLTIVEGSVPGKVFELPDRPAAAVSIGRSRSSPVHLDDNSVSREHATIEFDGHDFTIFDAHSANGVLVNDEAVVMKPLRHGDVIAIGRTRLRFDDDHAPEPAESSEVLELAVGFDKLEFGTPDAHAAVEKERAKLRTLCRVSEAIGTLSGREQILESIMDALFEIFPQAECAVLLLPHEQLPDSLVPKAERYRGPAERRPGGVLSNTVLASAFFEGNAILSSDVARDERFRGAESVIDLRIRSMMCVPLVHKSRILGILYLDTTDATKRFVSDDLSLLQGIARQAAIAIRNSELLASIEAETTTRARLQRFLSPALVDRVMKREIDLKLGGSLEHGTIFFSDIIGFTKMASVRPPADVVAALNRYFSIMVAIIFDYDGMLNKFGGDSMLAIWGITKSGTAANPHACAVEAALCMQAAVANFNFQLAAESQAPIVMGIGLNTGHFVAGNIGSEWQMEYTVIGDEVNLASRIESQAARGMVYVSESTWNEISGVASGIRMPAVSLKGIAQPVTMYSIRGIRPVHRDQTDTRLERRYLSIPADLIQHGTTTRAFVPRCRITDGKVTLDIHTSKAIDPRATVHLRLDLPEMPSLSPIPIDIVQQSPRQLDRTRTWELSAELPEPSPFLDELIVRGRTIDSAVDPASIPRI